MEVKIMLHSLFTLCLVFVCTLGTSLLYAERSTFTFQVNPTGIHPSTVPDASQYLLSRHYYPKSRVSLGDLGVQGLTLWPNSEVALPAQGFEPATFRLVLTPLSHIPPPK